MNNKKAHESMSQKAWAQVDFRSPNTYVFFGVQVIGGLWLVWVTMSQILSGHFSTTDLCITAAMIVARYYLGMWFVTVWRHRYFAHASFKLQQNFIWLENVVALICSGDAQRGICQWAAEHVWHHRYSDTPKDHHSCKQNGLQWCHWLWVVKKDSDRQVEGPLIPRLRNKPVLQWIENRQWIGIVLTGGIFSLVGVYLKIGGYYSFIANFTFSLCAYFFATTMLWHGTFLINSAMHSVGSKRYDTGDESRNSFICALLTLGEGWHNNHHNAFPSLVGAKRGKKPHRREAAALFWQGETFFERCFDWSGMSIWLMIKLGICKPLRSR